MRLPEGNYFYILCRFLSMKAIRDSIHGDIFLSDLEFEVIDTPEFQRLRRIRQLGMTYLVYPSANHTRFEHSLGSLHLAGRIAERLQLKERERAEVRLAALLHDVGHGPFSHTSGELMERFFNQHHEEVTGQIVEKSTIAEILENGGIEPKQISRILAGKRSYLSKIIASEFDADRMDYLVRDAHHTGAAYGVLDLDRLINTMQLCKGELVIEERGLRAAEALLVARFLMTPSVYLHHASRIADAMFMKAVEFAMREGLLARQDLSRMDDFDVQNLFRSASGYVREIGKRFDERRLFKKAYSADWSELRSAARKKLLALREEASRWKKLEEELSRDCGLAYGQVLIDVPQGASSAEMDAHVLKDGKLLKIEKASPLIAILREAQKSQWNFAVYAPKEHLAKVEKLCRNFEEYLD